MSQQGGPLEGTGAGTALAVVNTAVDLGMCQALNGLAMGAPVAPAALSAGIGGGFAAAAVKTFSAIL